MHPRLPVLVLLGACASGPDGSRNGPLAFTLRLRPLTPLNQPDLFDDVDRFTVTVDRGSAGVEVYDLGTAGADGTVRTPAVAGLDGAAIGIYGHGPEGELVAYGRSSAWTLPSDADDDVPVLVGRVGAIGRLTDLPGDAALVGAGLVADGSGRFLTFGGDERGLDGIDHATQDVLRLDIGRPDTSLSFSEFGDLPEYATVNGETAVGLIGHSTTRLSGNHDEQGWVLLAGGAAGMSGSSTITDRVMLFDPETEDVVVLEDPGRLPDGVYHHTADEFGSGYVAIIGGSVGRSG
ncbi:MAG: hypothetical protein VX000_04930, partial [Myxococcota bacterium]|nr:hypothetical protein [Myxococcota bacterium]